ncbi:hypothetical protein QP028_11280 [Corynebacterium suedekumii]|nr:hypothetical protein QP028_11280 [Corynebacterium suedekumii]
MPILTVLGIAAAIAMAYLGSGALVGTPVAEAAGGCPLRRRHPARPGQCGILHLGRDLPRPGGLRNLAC